MTMPVSAQMAGLARPSQGAAPRAAQAGRATVLPALKSESNMVASRAEKKIGLDESGDILTVFR
jgi:hypothetical protein